MKKMCLIILASNLVLIIIQFSLGSYISTMGDKITEISQKTDQLEEDNTRMSDIILERTSISYLHDQAEKMGFVKAKLTKFVTASLADAGRNP